MRQEAIDSVGITGHRTYQRPVMRSPPVSPGTLTMHQEPPQHRILPPVEFRMTGRNGRVVGAIVERFPLPTTSFFVPFHRAKTHRGDVPAADGKVETALAASTLRSRQAVSQQLCQVPGAARGFASDLRPAAESIRQHRGLRACISDGRQDHALPHRPG